MFNARPIPAVSPGKRRTTRRLPWNVLGRPLEDARSPGEAKPWQAQAFFEGSWNVRLMAIASPTLFICVVSVGSACGNFSKAKRATLVTR